MKNKAIKIGSVTAALSVILGAFGAHGLKKIVTDSHLLDYWDTAATYQLFHAIAIIIVGILVDHGNNKKLKFASNLFVIGIVLFSGSIYSLVLIKSLFNVGLGPLAMMTPIGGICFIFGWIYLFLAFNNK